jgi:hypothetical protein
MSISTTGMITDRRKPENFINKLTSVLSKTKDNRNQ